MIRVFLIILFIFISYSSANAVSGVADKYEVTMKKVELCQSSQCQAPTEVASGTQAVNIASLNAGAEAAKFGSTSGLPIGKSYSHLRVTLNRAFTIEGEVQVQGNNWCSTDAASAGTATALHTGTLDTDGTPTDGTDQTLFLANEGSYGASNGINISYGNLTSAISLKFSSATEVQLIYALSNTYTVGLVSPKIKVVFDVSSALGAGIDSGNNCLMWPEEPKVSITLTE